MPYKMDITPNYRLAIVLSDDVERETVPRGDATMAMVIIEHAAVYEDAVVAVVVVTDRVKGQGRHSAMRHRTAIAIICVGVAITEVHLMDVVVVAEIVAIAHSAEIADRRDILEIITGTTTFRHALRTMAMAVSVHTHRANHRRKEVGTDHRSRECTWRCPFCPFRITLLQHSLPTTRRTRKAAHRL